jgi:Nitroreductase
MNLTDIIKARTSVRSYSGEPLRREQKQQIEEYINGLAQPLGGKARVVLVSVNTGVEPVKLGTYGVISGAKDYLVLAYEPGELADQNAGYLFEQVVLLCTAMGLGTCWLGGTLKKGDFAEQAKLRDSEVLRIVSPVGFPADQQKFRDRIMRMGAGSDKRKPFGDLFFDGNFDKTLTEDAAGVYREALEMVRLAPSASNTQPWRVVVDGESLHFYYAEKLRFSAIDIGIAICHFGEVCRESGIEGAFKVLNEGDYPIGEKLVYTISWIK